jgi:hypothetical protein
MVTEEEKARRTVKNHILDELRYLAEEVKDLEGTVKHPTKILDTLTIDQLSSLKT